MSIDGLNDAIAVLRSQNWTSSGPYAFEKHGLEIVFDTSSYVELYREQERIAEARVTSAASMLKFLRDNDL